MDNTRNHQTPDNKNEHLNGRQNSSDEISVEKEQEIPEALKNFDRDSVRLNTGELVYSKNDLFTIRDKAGNEVYARPGNLSSVFCKDEPGNLINTFRIVGTNGESHKNEGQEYNKVRRPPPGLPATPSSAVRPPPGLPPLNSKSPHQPQQQPQHQQQRYREGYNNPTANNGNGTKNNNEYGNNKGERGRNNRGYNNNNTEDTNEEESIILSPPRKTFPSSQSANNQRGARSSDKHTAPPPGFNTKNNSNSYVPPNRRQNRDHGDADGSHSSQQQQQQQQQQHSKMRYQLKRTSVESNATPNSMPNNNINASASNTATTSSQNYIDDFLFGIGKDDANNSGYNWETFAKFNSVTLEEEDEEALEDESLESNYSSTIDGLSSPILHSSTSHESHNTPTSSRAFGRWFSLDTNSSDKGASPVTTPMKASAPPTTTNTNANTTIVNQITSIPPSANTTITTEPSITPSSSNSSSSYSSSKVEGISSNIPSNNNSLESKILPPTPYIDPVAESESASFITSLLSKATLQERNLPNNSNNISSFGQMQPPLNSNLPQNLPMHHLPHHLPPHMLHNPQLLNTMNPYLAHPQGPPNFMNMGVPTMNGPQPHLPQYMPMNRGAMPPPSPQQQPPAESEQNRAGLEKWFGQSIYNTTHSNTYQAGPLPPNARMMSLEELERHQPSNVSQTSK